MDSSESIENESKETIEQILRYYECDDSIFVKMIICMAGSQDGDNYMSVVKRLIVTGTHDKNQNENGNYAVVVFFYCQIMYIVRIDLN